MKKILSIISVIILISIGLTGCGSVRTEKPDIPTGLLIPPEDRDIPEPYPIGCNPETERCGFCFDADGAADIEVYIYTLQEWIKNNGK